jgi:hypothetical protein
MNSYEYELLVSHDTIQCLECRLELCVVPYANTMKPTGINNTSCRTKSGKQRPNAKKSWKMQKNSPFLSPCAPKKQKYLKMFPSKNNKEEQKQRMEE